jgi:hypothetical protein
MDEQALGWDFLVLLWPGFSTNLATETDHSDRPP